LGSNNLVLGIDPNETFEQHIVHLKSNDTLLMYTDGLADAMNFKQERFGTKRVRESFLKGGPNAEAIAQSVLWDMRRFVGLARRTDDVTMVAARVR
jgi:sigma-B regulation protein RsbU (phosphoserine phosphatase)